nr:uncharacterized protein LOC115110306 isoform X2 [Oncorhynchus nerka]
MLSALCVVFLQAGIHERATRSHSSVTVNICHMTAGGSRLKVILVTLQDGYAVGRRRFSTFLGIFCLNEDEGQTTQTIGNGTDQVLELGKRLLTDFIYERVRRHADSSTQLSVLQTQLGGSELCDPNHKKLAQCLQQIGDELDGNTQLQSMINDTALQPSQEVFMRVACEIFSDGKFNWGRVVALFYFACRLVIKVRVVSGCVLFSSPLSINLLLSCPPLDKGNGAHLSRNRFTVLKTATLGMVLHFTSFGMSWLLHCVIRQHRLSLLRLC